MLRAFPSYLSWLVLAMSPMAGAPFAQAADPIGATSTADAQGVSLVVLRNGEVLTGRIVDAGERVLIKLPDREISLRPSEIDVVAATLEEAYQLKRNKVRSSDVGSRLDLAAWCMYHELWPRAHEELNAVGTVQPFNPRLVAMRRRLQESATHAAVQSQAQEASRPSVPAGNKAKGGTAVARRAKDEVTQAGFLWPPAAADRASAATANTRTPVPDKISGPEATVTPATLERFVRSLPATAVEQFTGGLHPMIVRSCATAGCHGPSNATEFTLLRLPHGRGPSRRLTQRNLYNTAQLVDFANPAESRLLQIASQPHGPLTAGVFGDARSPRYQELVAWIGVLTGTEVDRGDAVPRGHDEPPVNWDRLQYAADRMAPAGNPADSRVTTDELQPNQPALVRTGVK